MRILDLVSGRKKPEAKAAAAETKNPEPPVESRAENQNQPQPEPEAPAISSTVEGIADPIATSPAPTSIAENYRVDAQTGELRHRSYEEWYADTEAARWAAMTPAQQQAVRDTEARCAAVDRAFAEAKRRRVWSISAFEPEWAPPSEMGPRQKI